MIGAWKRVYEVSAYTTMNIRDKADVNVQTINTSSHVK
jgi:hypothetical protein